MYGKRIWAYLLGSQACHVGTQLPLHGDGKTSLTFTLQPHALFSHPYPQVLWTTLTCSTACCTAMPAIAKPMGPSPGSEACRGSRGA